MALPPFVYSPFSRRWDELDSTDLEQLRRAEEGWYVEYKSEVPKADVAGKSLSAFANSHGGWIFYGVLGLSGSLLPTSFPGIADAAVPRLLEMLQKGATQVSPPPFFETKTIKGPDEATGLPAGQVVVAVRVPPGAKAPYVHINGRIYRRVADASEPTHETDRHVLDLLWERSRGTRDRWRELVEQKFEVSQAESGEPLVHVFLSCDPLGDRGARFDLDFDEFARQMRSATPASGPLPFDNVYSGSGCFIARQVATNDGFNVVLTWRQQFDGTAIVTIPLAWHRLDGAAVFDRKLHTYKHVGALRRACEKFRFSDGRIIDLNSLAHVLGAVLQRYRVLLRASKIHLPMFAKIRIEGVWRTVPFIDLPEFADFVDKHGPPLVQQSEHLAPPNIDTMYPLDNWRDDVDDQFADTLRLFLGAASALGVWLDPSAVINDWSGLLERARQRRAPAP